MPPRAYNADWRALPLSSSLPQYENRSTALAVTDLRALKFGRAAGSFVWGSPRRPTFARFYYLSLPIIRCGTLTRNRPCVHSSCQRQETIFANSLSCALYGILPKIRSVTLTEKRPCVHSGCQRQEAFFAKSPFCALRVTFQKIRSVTLTRNRHSVHSGCQRLAVNFVRLFLSRLFLSKVCSVRCAASF